MPFDTLDLEEIVIRTAVAVDAPALADLSRRTYSEAYGADMASEELDAHLNAALSVARWQRYLLCDTVLIAVRRALAVGFLQYGPANRVFGIEIRRVYVERRWQGRGIGSALLSTALLSPTLADALSLQITVWQHNLRARRFYERFGFVETGRQVPFVLTSGKIAGYDIVLERGSADD